MRFRHVTENPELGGNVEVKGEKRYFVLDSSKEWKFQAAKRTKNLKHARGGSAKKIEGGKLCM